MSKFVISTRLLQSRAALLFWQRQEILHLAKLQGQENHPVVRIYLEGLNGKRQQLMEELGYVAAQYEE